jgi:hypothetical protein
VHVMYGILEIATSYDCEFASPCLRSMNEKSVHGPPYLDSPRFMGYQDADHQRSLVHNHHINHNDLSKLPTGAAETTSDLCKSCESTVSQMVYSNRTHLLTRTPSEPPHQFSISHAPSLSLRHEDRSSHHHRLCHPRSPARHSHFLLLARHLICSPRSPLRQLSHRCKYATVRAIHTI